MNKEVKPRKFGLIGTIFGALALIVAISHFFLGPIEQAPTIEEFVAEKTSSISEALRAGLTGEGQAPTKIQERSFGPDQVVEASVAGLSILAIVLAVFGFIQREDLRPTGTAVLLGGAALTFQLAIAIVGAILAVIIIAAIINALGIG